MKVYFVPDAVDQESRPLVNSEENAVAAVLGAYQSALNASDADAVMALYAHDGVFMPQNSASRVGTSAVRRAYDNVFRAITLSVTFQVVEVVQVAATWAFARTNSAGKTTIHATGATTAEANQELFVFTKVDGAWKIARYCFATTSPAKA